MDRMITHGKRSKFSFFGEFEYLHLFPYTLALLMVAGEIYILTAFINISRNLH
jgi:hypothetical protein